jgi:hypothetical protein
LFEEIIIYTNNSSLQNMVMVQPTAELLGTKLDGRPLAEIKQNKKTLPRGLFQATCLLSMTATGCLVVCPVGLTSRRWHRVTTVLSRLPALCSSAARAHSSNCLLPCNLQATLRSAGEDNPLSVSRFSFGNSLFSYLSPTCAS